MSARTPTPWRDGPVFNTEGKALFFTDTSKPGTWQRRVDKAGIFSAEDAAYIVRCVNSHAELLAALEAAESQLTALLCSRTLDSTCQPFYSVRETRDAARSAIARAQG